MNNSPEINYNPNEIHNNEDVVNQETSMTRRIATYVALALFVGSVVFIIIASVTGMGAFNVIQNPRAIILPFGLLITVLALVLKSQSRVYEKDSVLEIIDEIDDHEIPVTTIVERYKEDYEIDEKMDMKQLEKKVTDRLTDLLWEGRLPTHKYVIGRRVLVRVDTAQD
ncbi:MAG: hypothetical protein FWE38_03525 [Firmicutes bacterium]|nr:hypothetical protein [Bacillota bacterium]